MDDEEWEVTGRERIEERGSDGKLRVEETIEAIKKIRIVKTEGQDV